MKRFVLTPRAKQDVNAPISPAIVETSRLGKTIHPLPYLTPWVSKPTTCIYIYRASLLEKVDAGWRSQITRVFPGSDRQRSPS